LAIGSCVLLLLGSCGRNRRLWGEHEVDQLGADEDKSVEHLRFFQVFN
jgi:hypothetical protein